LRGFLLLPLLLTGFCRDNGMEICNTDAPALASNPFEPHNQNLE